MASTNYKERLITAFPVFSHLLKKQKLFAQAIVSGGAAGNLTVEGIKAGDELISVVDVSGNSQTVADGAVAGDVTVTGIAIADKLVSVINLTDGTDITSEFTISAADTINNTGGATTAGDTLLVVWEKVKSNVVSEFIITKDGTINNTDGTATTGKSLLVTWMQWAQR